MKTILGGFDGAAARRAVRVDAMKARKERRWIIRESLYSLVATGAVYLVHATYTDW
jgi:hypothetical protein